MQDDKIRAPATAAQITGLPSNAVRFVASPLSEMNVPSYEDCLAWVVVSRKEQQPSLQSSTGSRLCPDVKACLTSVGRSHFNEPP